ncbi:Scn10a [Symbiodinium pilosum]|uniref:Scn10a protein n=1 Tax=Symbiodinium pilosum TaxID=2952 RepID=A0A812Q8I2_SYMPI|nr:Scn10a [Symbiodinium pilosum]
MLDCVLGSFLQIFWCLAMIVFVLYVFSLLIVQGIVDLRISAGETLKDEDVIKLEYYYPSVGQTLLTLFQSTTAGLDWRDAFEALEKGGPFLSVVFLVYISIFTISIWNIVTSTFVEKAMKLAKPDLDSMLLEQSMRDLKDTEELENLFRPYATQNADGEEEISLSDLQDAADEAEFLLYLSVRGIDVKNVKLFFYMLGSMHKNSVVDLKSLVKACVRMKGFATSIDLQSVSFEAKLMHSQTKDLFKVLRLQV